MQFWCTMVCQSGSVSEKKLAIPAICYPPSLRRGQNAVRELIALNLTKFCYYFLHALARGGKCAKLAYQHKKSDWTRIKRVRFIRVPITCAAQVQRELSV